jgi:osmotically inducible lipoprotein OsmB
VGYDMTIRNVLILAAGLGLSALAGCGTNMEQRAATGAATGLIIAGPVGAAVGATVGVVVDAAGDK